MPTAHDARSVAFVTLGCKVNRADSDAMAAALPGSVFVTEKTEQARVVVVNSCTVTAEADAKCRKLVRRLLAEDSERVVILTGCLAAIDAGALQDQDRVVLLADKRSVPARVAEILAADSGAPPLQARVARRARVGIKVQDGCDVRCAYCIVPDARGVPVSAPMSHLVAEVAALVERGVGEVVLSGINIGRYRDAGADLSELVRAVAATGIPRIRISSIEPVDLTEHLLAALADTSAVCPHLHVPLQSGSDAVLATMRRRYDTADFVRAIASVRHAMPAAAISTDVIAGHPGETAAQHEESMEFCRAMGFSRLHVFRYSRRADTPAAAMVQIESREVARRAQEFRDLGEELRSSWAGTRVGGRAQILLETRDGGTWRGTSEDYLEARVEDVHAHAVPGQIIGTDVITASIAGADVLCRATGSSAAGC